jgi:hypothetical protein
MTGANLRVVTGGALPAVIDEAHVERSTRALRKSIPQLALRWNGDCTNLLDIEVDGVMIDADRDAAIAKVRASLAPVGSPPVVALLQRLKLTTADRGRPTTEVAAQFASYAANLGRYPRDVVQAVCAEGAHQWFPTLKELLDAADRLVRQRRMMLAALERAGTKQLPEPPPQTQADKDHVDAIVAKALAALRMG